MSISAVPIEQFMYCLPPTPQFTVKCTLYSLLYKCSTVQDSITVYVQRKLENQQITNLFGLPEKFKKFRSARRTNREIGEIIRTVYINL